MMDLNKNVGALKEQMNALINKLPPEQRVFARDSINLMREAETPEVLNKIRDEQIEKARKLEDKK